MAVPQRTAIEMLKLWKPMEMMSFRLMRLQGYGVFEALVCLLAHRVCGTPMYWYPKATREKMRAARHHS